MKKLLLLFPLALLLAVQGCKLIDPTDVKNPNVLETDFQGSVGSAAAWQSGLARQLAVVMSAATAGAELASDNYFNNQTLANRVFDIPLIQNADPDVTTIQVEVGRLREMAKYGLEKVLPADTRATTEQRAEFQFYRGMAHLLAGELFVALPAEPLSPALPAADNLRQAVAAFQIALSTSQTAVRQNAYRLALARAYYYLGDRQNATDLASRVLTDAPTFTRFVTFDFTNGVSSLTQNYLFRRSANDYQPLPRLDFLDPKFSGSSNTFDDSLCVLKTEDAHLILAENDLAANQPAAARTRLTTLLTLVNSRPRRTFSDAGETRGAGGLRTDYPKTADIRVAASPQDSVRSGLVLSRRTGATISVPILSGTSVTIPMLNRATTVEELLELLYLMRQEIFMAEGRRMTDLGIRWPVAERELLNNPAVTTSFGQAQIPAFIPNNSGMDNFTVQGTTYTIQTNMNRVLVQNRTSPLVVPFF